MSEKPVDLLSPTKSRRLVLSARELYILRTVLAYMTHKASSLNAEGQCLLDMARGEIHSLRKRLS